MRPIRIAFMTLAAIVIAALTVWASLAIYFSNLPSAAIRELMASVFALFGLVMLGWYLFSVQRRRPLFVFLAVFLLLVIWWSSTRPSRDRDWATEYSRLA